MIPKVIVYTNLVKIVDCMKSRYECSRFSGKLWPNFHWAVMARHEHYSVTNIDCSAMFEISTCNWVQIIFKDKHVIITIINFIAQSNNM